MTISLYPFLAIWAGSLSSWLPRHCRCQDGKGARDHGDGGAAGADLLAVRLQGIIFAVEEQAHALCTAAVNVTRAKVTPVLGAQKNR